MGERKQGTKSLITILGLVVVAGILYAGVKAFPVFFRASEFKEDLDSQAHYADLGGRSAEQVGDAIYRDAQRWGLPLQREDIHVGLSSSGTVVTAHYRAPVDLYFFQPALQFHVHYPGDKRLIPLGHQFALLTLGLLFALYWFFKGFWIYRKFRVIADVPVVPIRGVAMGLVQIHGTALGEKTLLSPVSRIPCFFYKVNIERWSPGGRGSGSWTRYLTDCAWVRFYLQDETGKVLVDPRGADCDLEQTGQCEVSSRPTLLPGHAWEAEPSQAAGPGIPPSDSELRSYVSRVAAGMRSELFQGADLSAGASPTFSERTGPGVLRRSLGFLQPVLAILQPQSGFGILQSTLGSGPSGGGYRLTEQCILTEASYDVTGTCAENSEAQEEEDRHILVKGANASTFLISSQSEKSLEAGLRARALRYILGGGLLAIGCAAALLQNLGYL